MKKIRIALIWKVLAACVAGALVGHLLPLPVVRIFTTFSAIFSQYIGFMIPLIIVGMVTPAICRVGEGAGKLLLITVGLAYLSTVLSGLFSYSVSSSLFPKLVEGMALPASEQTTVDAPPFFSLTIPPMMDIMTVLCLSFIFGALLTVTHGENLIKIVYDIENVIVLAIKKTLIPLLPLYIFGIFVKMSFTGEIAPILAVFAKVIVIIFVMTWVWLLILFCISGIISHKNPLKMFVRMLPAYATALGTSSSAATIPVTLNSARSCGVSDSISGFTVPLCATIHLPGSTIKVTACAVTVMILNGNPFDFPMFFGFIALLGITAVAAPGVPGGMIMAALGVLSSVLGFGETEQALMIALYVVMDSFGTAANVTGDGALSIIIDALHVKIGNEPLKINSSSRQ